MILNRSHAVTLLSLEFYIWQTWVEICVLFLFALPQIPKRLNCSCLSDYFIGHLYWNDWHTLPRIPIWHSQRISPKPTSNTDMSSWGCPLNEHQSCPRWSVKTRSAKKKFLCEAFKTHSVSHRSLHGDVQFVNIKAWPSMPTSDLRQREGDRLPILSIFQPSLFFLLPCSFLYFLANCHQLIFAAFSKLFSSHVLSSWCSSCWNNCVILENELKIELLIGFQLTPTRFYFAE